MKPCPTCGAICGDDDTFCEADGTKLDAMPQADPEGFEPTMDMPFRAGAPTSAIKGPCSACGSVDTDDGDGYCKVCGHRLDQVAGGPPTQEQPAIPQLRTGLTLGRYVVQAPVNGDDARATTPDGVEVLIILGDPAGIEAEAEATLALSAHSGFPRLVEHGEVRPYAFLAVSPSPVTAQRLLDVVQNGNATLATRVIRALLDVAERVEAAGFTFQPAVRDLLLEPGGSVVLARLRDARRTSRPLDARRFLEALGEIFLPPALLGPTGLMRLLVPNRESAEGPGRSIRDIRAALDDVDADLATPAQTAPIAELCDPGLWRPYNQDATAVAEGKTPSGEPFVILVVCDGVSSSSFSEMASSIAARAARDALAHFARSPDIKHETTVSAVGQAIRAAHLAICAAHVAEPVSDLPGTTIAAGLIYRRRLTIGWVGDSRCYWLTQRGAELLTHDHSWVNEAIARGEVKDATEVQGALAHTITKCLGPLEVGDIPAEVEPDVRCRDLAGPGLVLLCSDGLWNYAPEPEDIARVMHVSPDETNAVAMARLFVNYALARGGQDNVSVALYVQA